MYPLTGLDAVFLAAETPAQHMQILATLVLDPSTAPEPFTFARIKALVAARLDAIPVLRWKLGLRPVGVSHGAWSEDPDFNLDFHVRAARLPAPGGFAELEAFTADCASRKLDRTRPLWELWFVDGLENGRVALVGKVHHATADGNSGLGLLGSLFDLEADAPLAPENVVALPAPAHTPSVASLAGQVASGAVRFPAVAVRTLGSAASSGVRLARQLMGSSIDAAMPFTGPTVSFNRALTPNRSVAFGTVDLADVKLVKDVFGVRVNDVVLAMVTGGLRRYLLDRHELPDIALVAAVPRSVRTDVPRAAGQNVVATMFASLHVEIADPVRRLLAVARRAEAAKQVHETMGHSTMGDLFEGAPAGLFGTVFALHQRFGLANHHRALVNVTVSNVMGPDFPVYMAGGRLSALYPMGPIVEGAGLNVTVASYLNRVHFGIVACREHMPEPEHLAEHIPEALNELVKAASRYS